VYYVDGVAMNKSVTGLIESVASEHFDPDAIIAKMKMGRNWPNPAYADSDEEGKLVPWDDARIKAAWKANGIQASELGTDLHSKIELFMNGEEVVFGDGPDNNRTEFGYFQAWWDTVKDEYEPFRTEWVIYDTDLKLAGSIDFVMRSRTTGKYRIVDWKRCKTNDAGFSNAFGKRLLPPLRHVPQTKSNKWGLQVNVYREVLERHYGVEIDGMSMVVFHQTNGTFQEFAFERSPDAGLLLSTLQK
jgi:ATP-dependent exoDNAse (exonuclease V) beta subunit